LRSSRGERSLTNRETEGEQTVGLKLISALALSATLAWVGPAAADSFTLGEDYGQLGSRQPSSTSDKVEVIEFFSYGCPHCADLEPHLREWAGEVDTGKVELVKVPVAWNRGMESFARVYYAADMLDASDEAHAAMFDLLHGDKPQQLTLPIIADTFAQHGVDKDAFLREFESEAVTQKVRQAQEMTRRYRVSGVPVLIVDGFYTVGIPGNGDFDRMFAITDYLVEQAAEGS
jgi:thiol:disulfide interchange protein DsbA